MKDRTNDHSEPRHFTVDARAMLTWGRDSIKDHTTAVLELVKNSYDAGATIVEVTINAHGENADGAFVRIGDDGIGMTDDDVRTRWLKIGFSEKLQDKVTRRGRRKTGEKGIGRISADRLGNVLELRTQAKSADAVGVKIDWRSFEVSGPQLQDIPIPDLEETDFDVPRPSVFDKQKKQYRVLPRPIPNSRRHSGTELTIRHLRQSWTKKDLQDLQRELSVFTSPFGGPGDFQIRLVTDIASELNGIVVSPFFQAAEIEAEFELGEGDTIRCRFIDRDKEGKPKPGKPFTTSWENFVHLDTNSGEDVVRPNFGPASIRLFFYPQRQETLRGTDFSKADLKEFLEFNAGIKVYRDAIRVMPYGDPRKPEGDWLGLGARKASDPAGPSRPSWKVAPTQIVGAVFLGRDTNPHIVDTSGREGLIHGEEFIGLKAFIFGCLFALEAHYHELFLKRSAENPPPPSPRRTLNEFDEGLGRLGKQMREVKGQLPAGAGRATERLKTHLVVTQQRVTRLRKSIDELTSQATIYRGLATLGITVATFGHEIEASLDQFMSSAHTANNLLGRGSLKLKQARDEITKAIQFGRKVSTWGAYALGRVKPDKRTRRKLPVHTLIKGLIEELHPAMDASSITVHSRLPRIQSRVFAMDIESVVINLLANAYYFSKRKRGPRTISVELSKREHEGEPGMELVVSDSGPGVAPRLREQVWEPLFSTKLDRLGRAEGTGLGLSIVDAVVKDVGGTRTIDTDPKLGGARFTVWLRTE